MERVHGRGRTSPGVAVHGGHGRPRGSLATPSRPRSPAGRTSPKPRRGPAATRPGRLRNALSGVRRVARGIRETSSRGRAGLHRDRGGRASAGSRRFAMRIRVAGTGKRRNSVRSFPAAWPGRDRRRSALSRSIRRQKISAWPSNRSSSRSGPSCRSPRRALGRSRRRPTGTPRTGGGPLRWLKRGIAPKDVVKKLVTEDTEAAQRQVGVVDARGRAASYTGKECFPWAGHVVGRNFAAQGNILAGEEVLKALARAFEVTQGDLPVRLLAALSAGQRAGGDKRGQQSAALLVVRQGGGYGGFNDRWIDIRIDDHPAPIEELIRIFNVYDLTLLTREDPKDVVVLKPNVVREIQAGFAAPGAYPGPGSGKFDAKTKAAFETWAEMNNYQNKLRQGGKVWGSLDRALKAQGAATSG